MHYESFTRVKEVSLNLSVRLQPGNYLSHRCSRHTLRETQYPKLNNLFLARFIPVCSSNFGWWRSTSLRAIGR